MDKVIVQSQDYVTLLGAADLKTRDIEEALMRAPILVAADGGVRHAIAHGYGISAAIGDFDSIDPETKKVIPANRIHEIAEQDSTDFEKCLRAVAAPLILALGFTGWRIDHELAVYNALARYPGKRCIVVGDRDIVVLAPPHLELDLEPGTRLSLFPMAATSGRSDGLRWPIDDIAFAPDGRVGTSNQVTGPVRLEFDQPGMLVILPRAALAAAIAGLAPG